MTRGEGMLIDLVDKVKRQEDALNILREEVERLKKESYGTKAASARAKKQVN